MYHVRNLSSSQLIDADDFELGDKNLLILTKDGKTVAVFKMWDSITKVEG